MAFSFFFRDVPTLEYAIDFMVTQTQGRSRIKIWDAGCAMGQEVYTMAILLAEKMGYFGFQNVQIEATDIEPEFEKIVTLGEYPANDLVRIPDKLREKYFEPGSKAENLRIIAPLRNKVNFTLQNLLDLKPITNGVSLIVCKNVLLHLKPNERINVYNMFHGALDKDGIMANENTQKLPGELDKLFEGLRPDAQIYRKKEVFK
jgi:chemotaxis protein methyltransferase CheR